MKKQLPLILFLFLCTGSMQVHGEGTRELLDGNCNNKGFPQIWDNADPARQFATYNCDPIYRLNIRVTAGEKIYFGYATDIQDVWYRLKDPNGNIVKGPTLVTSNSANGWITSCSKAMNGPKSLNGSGYKNMSYTATQNGDYYIEFAVNNNPTFYAKRIFELFDVTVANNGQAQTGRLWSMAWDLNCMGGNNPFQAEMHTYTPDSFVTSFDFNGIRPWGFVISCNSFGTTDIGSIEQMRQSDYRQNIFNNGGTPGVPEYPIFLNEPDIDLFPTGRIGEITAIDLVPNGIDYCVDITLTKQGQLETTLIFQGGPPRQFLDFAEAGVNCISWDGLDGNGNVVSPGAQIEIRVKYAMGRTHLPLTDVEHHLNGFAVGLERPLTFSNGNPIPQPQLYWDDTQLTDPANNLDGTSNLNGCVGGCHQWQNRGNNNQDPEVINTWWYFSTEYDTLLATVLPLPVELIFFDANALDDQVRLEWATGTENNSAVFEIQRTQDATNFETVATVAAAGYSQSTLHYETVDAHPLDGSSYYRLKQIDVDGKVTYSPMAKVAFNSACDFRVYPNPAIDQQVFLSFCESQNTESLVTMYDPLGRLVFSKMLVFDDDGGFFGTINSHFDLSPGIYLVVGSSNNKLYNQKLVIKEEQAGQNFTFHVAANR